MMGYIKDLVKHYETYFCVKGNGVNLACEPTGKLVEGFIVLEIPPNKQHDMYCYCTVGMSAERSDNLIELLVYSPKTDLSLVELLTACASYHRNNTALNLHHTVNIGQPWLDSSICDYGFISLPYLDGEELELFQFEDTTINCYWLIPITKEERDYKIKNGVEALEQLFEDKQLDYLNPNRKSLI